MKHSRDFTKYELKNFNIKAQNDDNHGYLFFDAREFFKNKKAFHDAWAKFLEDSHCATFENVLFYNANVEGMGVNLASFISKTMRMMKIEMLDSVQKLKFVFR